MGDDDPRLRWHRLHGISPEVQASNDGELTYRSSGLNGEAAFGRLFLCEFALLVPSKIRPYLNLPA